MKKTHDIVATVGKYTDREGTEKKRYIKIGVMFEDDQGRQSLKVDAFPCSPEWSGWLSLYPVERVVDGRGRDLRAEQQETHQRTKQDGYQQQEREPLPHHSEVDPGDGDEIPF